MAINFPSSPSVNQIYTYQSRSWQWDGNAWLQVRTGVASVGNEVPGGSKNGVNTVFTTAAPFITGTLRVYLNGQRLTETDDYTVGTSSITMLTAPLATDILLVDYYTHTGEIATGSASTITNEVPSGSVDGVNKVFTCAHAFVSGTLQVFRDGQLMKGGGDDYTETNPATGTFTFVTAPVSGTTLLTCYQAALSTVGNADTLDGYHASSFSMASTMKGHIEGLQMVRVSDTAVTIKTGSAYIPYIDTVVVVSSDIVKTGLSLSASTWYHLYLYINGSIPDIEISTVAPVIYHGTARNKTGDTSRRYIGSVKTDSSGWVYGFVHHPQSGLLLYTNRQDQPPFRVLSNGRATVETAFSFSSCVPTTSRIAKCKVSNLSTLWASMGNSEDTVAVLAAIGIFVADGGTKPIIDYPLSSDQQATYVYPGDPGASGVYIDVYGYFYER